MNGQRTGGVRVCAPAERVGRPWRNDVNESYQAPAGEPSRPLPPYRPLGPQAGAPAPVAQTTFSPIPSQSMGAPAAAPYGQPTAAPYGGPPAPSYQPAPNPPTQTFMPTPAQPQ